MMQIKHIKTTECSYCGSAIKSCNIKARTHCNGQQWEEIEFECGAKVIWSPIFSKEQLKEKCPKSLKKNLLYELADSLHDLLCHHNHTDECSWEYGSWEDEQLNNSRKEYLEMAESIISKYFGSYYKLKTLGINELMQLFEELKNTQMSR